MGIANFYPTYVHWGESMVARTSALKVAISHDLQVGSGCCLGTQPEIGFSSHRILLNLLRLPHNMVTQFQKQYTKRTQMRVHCLHYAALGPLGSGEGREYGKEK